MQNPFEGKPIFFEKSSNVCAFQAIIYESREAWEKRHPGRRWEEDRMCYPDALRATNYERDEPIGPILPRVKNRGEITDDDVAQALANWPLPYNPRDVLAKDISLYAIFPDQDPDD